MDRLVGCLIGDVFLHLAGWVLGADELGILIACCFVRILVYGMNTEVLLR